MVVRVVLGLDLRWRLVVERGVDLGVVEPVDPAQGGQLEFFRASPRSFPVHEFGLVEPAQALGEGVVVGVANGPDRGVSPASVSRSVYRIEVYWAPASVFTRTRVNTDRGSTYTAKDFTKLCAEQLGIRRSMGRVGSCFDNAAAESFFSTLEWEVLSRNEFRDPDHARQVVLEWCHEFYNTVRRHTSAAMMSPINYENLDDLGSEAA